MTPGSLRLIQSPANTHGANDSQLFLFVGDPTVAPIHKIIPQDDVILPSKQNLASAHLKILHINDLHGHLLDLTPKGEQPIFSRIVGRIREVRSHYQDDPDTAVLAMSAGDDIIGSLFSELLGTDADSFTLHAPYRLYSVAGIDVSVLGNHDLDLGPAVLARGIQQDARFPVLSANLKNCQQLKNLAYPAALFVTKGIRVGIIGLTTIAETRQPLNSKLELVDPVSVVKNLLPAMQPICDLIIILSHLGYCQDAKSGSAPGASVGDVELAQSVPTGSVALIVGGHTHNALNQDGLQTENVVNGIPIVQSGAFGEFLGQVDISIEKNLASVANVHLTPTESLPVDHEFEEQEIQPLIARVRNIESQILGTVEDDPQLGTDVVQQDFASSELALANFITDAMVTQLRQADYEVDFAMIDASSLMCGLPFSESLSFGEWFKVMPFADTVRFYKITGQQLNDLLQDNVGRMKRSDEQLTERGFLQFSNQVRYSIELGKTRFESRSSNILVKGTPLNEQLDAVFMAAATIFTRDLACKWETDIEQSMGISLMKLQSLPHTKTDVYLRKMLVAYIQDQGGVTRNGGARLDGRLSVTKKKPDTNSAKTEFIEGRNL